jgi:hypothetical protein
MQGLIVTGALYGRCLMHVKYAMPENTAEYISYDFWMHHHHINESVEHVTSAPLAEPCSASSMRLPDLLCLNMNIQAVLICLHHAAVLRVSKTNTLSLSISESETKCLAAAMEVTDTTRQIGYLDLGNVRFHFHLSRLQYESFPSLGKHFAFGSDR